MYQGQFPSTTRVLQKAHTVLYSLNSIHVWGWFTYGTVLGCLKYIRTDCTDSYIPGLKGGAPFFTEFFQKYASAG